LGLRVSLALRWRTGNLVAKHQKIHLYDCDFPGGVYFKVRLRLPASVVVPDKLAARPAHQESDSMSAGTRTTIFTTRATRLAPS
jgi:predicted amidohydrolase